MPSRKRSAPEQLVLPWAGPGLVAGVDEAGRGPLAGPVVAAAVILDDQAPIPGLADSKALTPMQRERLEARIMASALCVGVGEASVEEIDTHNILRATMLAMQRAIQRLRLRPSRVLVDGNQIPLLPVSAEAIVGGDAKVAVISAASIVAKVHRDRLCLELDRRWPQYGFAAHKGYGSARHLQALQEHGACLAHRRSFAPVQRVLGRAALAPDEPQEAPCGA